MSFDTVLWISPLPPTRSGVADYAAEILPCLAKLRNVEILEPPGWKQPNTSAAWLSLPRTSVPRSRRTTLPLVHLGNNPYHIDAARWLRDRGGIAVIHDLVLHHLMVEEARTASSWDRFKSELGDLYGARGQAVAEARTWGLQGAMEPFLFPATGTYLRLADGVIVHNRAALEHVIRVAPALPVRQVPLAVDSLPGGDRNVWRERLGVASDELVVTHLGFLTPAKGLGAIVRAVVVLKQLGARFRLVVVGEGSEAGALARMVAEAGLGADVVLWGYATTEELGGILSATDLGLVPRFPTAGETSAAVIRFFAAAVPVVVSGYRQFLELPAAAAFRMAPGPSGGVDLVRLVRRLAACPDELNRARMAARATAADHVPERAAAALDAAITDISGAAA